jgi:predicted outer membrane repeat protein
LVTPYGNDVDFINCKFIGNEAGDYGGGIYSASNSAMTGCLFHNNRAATDNSEEGGGGAILQAQSNAFILNSTFSGNTASGSSSIYCEDGNIAMVNSILWDDTLSEEPKIYMSQIGDPTSIYIAFCDIEGAQGVIRGDGDYEIDWAEGNISSDPLFESFGTDFSLSNESPCIDTGQLGIYAGLLPLSDLAGNPRVFRGMIDLGCYENQFPFGIEEVTDNQDFLVYPNPARDHFYLRNESDILFVGSYSISDLSGRMIRSMDIHLRPGEGMRESCAELPKGMYVMKLSNENYSSAFKLVIQE